MSLSMKAFGVTLYLVLLIGDILVPAYQALHALNSKADEKTIKMHLRYFVMLSISMGMFLTFSATTKQPITSIFVILSAFAMRMMSSEKLYGIAEGVTIKVGNIISNKYNAIMKKTK